MSAGDMARALDELRARTGSDAWSRDSEIDTLLDLLYADEYVSAHWDSASDGSYPKRGWREARDAKKRRFTTLTNPDSNS
jgi:hypothetical protein